MKGVSKERVKRVQRRVGASADGVFGRDTFGAVEDALGIVSTDYNGIPADTYRDLVDTYGRPGDENLLTKIKFPYPMRLAWDHSTTVKTSRVHRLAKKDLVSILQQIKSLGGDFIREHGLDLYGGIFNPRKIRGGSSWSRHAWGIAIDLNPDENGLRTPWPGRASMPVEVVEIFEDAGWKSGARAWGRDAMHFQRTR